MALRMSPSPLVGGHRAVGQHEPRHAGGREVVDDVLNPGVVGVAHRRRAVFPAGVFTEALAAPVGDIEGRIGEDEVGLEVLVQVAVEGVGRCGPRSASMPRMARFILASRQVVGLRLLAVDGDVADAAAVGLDEPLGLDEHAAGAAAGVVDAALVRVRSSRRAAAPRSGACRTRRRALPSAAAKRPRKYS